MFQIIKKRKKITKSFNIYNSSCILYYNKYDKNNFYITKIIHSFIGPFAYRVMTV